ncbi:phage tail tape measure protein [uncultured Anaeromusa sp.]|uniref:phage tail tape measure protein n=1 Tax=uncultured Anaeromusa sp. TaxID=673273 RepID=UPI0029C91324|nr:phage tail tape measure protein [uncultured Anaeromusa sp.]
MMAGKVFEMAFNLTARIGSFVSGMTSSSSALSGLNQRINLTNTALRNLDRAHREGAISAEQHARATAALRQQLNSLRQSQDRVRSSQSSVKSNAQNRANYRGEIVEAIGLAAALAAPVRQAMRFEDQMASVRKVVDFDSPEQFKEMGEDIKNMSRRLPVAADGIAKIVAAGGQAGIAREDLTTFAEDASKMAIAFDTTAEDAGQKMAVWRTTFKLSQDDVRSLANQINYLSDISPTTANGISAIVTRVGALGGLSGLAAGEVAALGSAMPGLEEEVAATSLKKLFTVMTAGFSATKTQRGMMEALGFDAENLAVRMQEDAKGAVLDFLGAIKQLPAADQMSYISEIFGEEGKAGIGILLQNLDIVSSNFQIIGDTTKFASSMQREFESRASTTSNQLQLLANNMAIVGMTAGNILLPHINDLALKMITVAEWVDNLNQKYPGLTNTIVVGTAAVIGLRIATFTLGYGFSLLMAPITAANAAMVILTNSTERAALVARIMAHTQGLQTAAQWLFNASLYGCPVVWIIGGIMALVAAGYLLYSNWDWISAKGSELWGDLQEGAGEACDAVGGFFATLPDDVAYALGYMVGYLETMPERATLYAYETADALGTWIGEGVDSATQFISTLPENTAAALSNFLQNIELWGSEVYNSVVNWFSRIPDAITSAIGRAGTFVSNLADSTAASFDAGRNAGSDISVAANANGGIYGRGSFLTTFAEEGAEAAIPLDGSPRALSLWAQAGEMLGIRPGGGGGTIVATFSPAITIYGTPEPGQVESEVEKANRSFLDFLHDERRLSFADD